MVLSGHDASAQGYRSRIKLIAASPLGATRLDDLSTEALDRWYGDQDYDEGASRRYPSLMTLLTAPM